MPLSSRAATTLTGALVLLIVSASCSTAGEVVTADPTGSSSESTAATSAPTSVATTEAPTTTAQPTTTTTAPPTTAPPTTLAPDERPLPTDPASTATELDEAELALRDPSLAPEEAMAYGRRQQQMYRVLSANRDWADEVIESVDPSVRAAVELNWEARQNLSALVSSGTLSSTLPAWRLREPLPADELIGYYKEAEAETGIPWTYLAAINLVETRMGRIEGLSTAGAVGPMQFLPSTWDGCCEGDPTQDRDAIIGAGVYLTLVGGPADMQSALFGYNRSQRYVDAVDAYAQVLAENELAYRGYHAWQVYFLSSAGLILMPSGYEELEPIAATEWLADNPDALIAPPD